MTASISFIALYAENLEATADFYRALGLPLTREQHGDGPVHYSTPIGDTVLELFQATKDKPKTEGLTIGVAVDDAEGVMEGERQKSSATSEQATATSRLRTLDNNTVFAVKDCYQMLR